MLVTDTILDAQLAWLDARVTSHHQVGFIDLTWLLQVLLFTATMPDTLQEAASKWQRKPVMIHLAPGDMSISKTVMQV